MHHDSDLHCSSEPGPALVPAFTHPDIAKRYQQGELSRLEAEVADIVRDGLATLEQDSALPIPLNAERLPVLCGLTCIALIQDGQVLPLLDIEQMTPPTSMLQRIQLYHATARTLLEAIAAIYEERAAQRQRPQDDENEGGPCYAR